MQKYAEELNTNLFCIGEDFSYTRQENKTWSFKTAKLNWEDLPMPSLYGRAQLSNAATALMGTVCIDEQLPVTRECVGAGLSNISLPGRFQVLQSDCQVVLDVAHNLDSAEVLVENLKELDSATKNIAVFAVLADKDVDGIIDAIKHIFDEWHISELDSERTFAAEKLHKVLTKYCPESNVYSHPTITAAYACAKQNVDASMRIVVFGSFLTVAEVLRQEV